MTEREKQAERDLWLRKSTVRVYIFAEDEEKEES